MNTRVNRILALAALAVAATVALTACAGDDGPSGTPAEIDRQIIVDFAGAVVIPTYTLLATRAAVLGSAVEALARDTTEANLVAAQDAWIAARLPWEESEGFLFGPVDALGLDPSLDSWPLNRTDLDAVLRSSDALTIDTVRLLPNEQRGFHTIEFLLFGEGRAKTAADFTSRETEYLRAATSLLASDAEALRDSWTQGAGGAVAYREVYATAGTPGNTTYPSLSAAAQEIVSGMAGICDEVANGKIADPFDNQDTTLVESQWSFNSLTDFASNMHSVRNAYLGDAPEAGTAGMGLTDHVASLDAALDARVKAEIDAAIDALGAIPEPFRAAITDPSAAGAITAAQRAIRTLQHTLEQDVLPLVTQ